MLIFSLFSSLCITYINQKAWETFGVCSTKIRVPHAQEEKKLYFFGKEKTCKKVFALRSFP